MSMKKKDAMERLYALTSEFHPVNEQRLNRAVRALLRERAKLAVAACDLAVPRAHTYASENADVYRAGDAARERCKNALHQAIMKGARK